jgi:hypothetical protein
MKTPDELRSMMEKLDKCGALLPHEATAYDYLIEPLYENLPFQQNHEGARLYRLCAEVIESAIERMGL